MTDDTEKPRAIYWRGRQWCVTSYGLETNREDRYYIERSDLTHLTRHSREGDPPMLERMRHTGCKVWVDIEDFIAAYGVALTVHSGSYREAPQGAFLNTVARIRKRRADDEEYEALHPPSDGMIDARESARRTLDFMDREQAPRDLPWEQVGELFPLPEDPDELLGALGLLPTPDQRRLLAEAKRSASETSPSSLRARPYVYREPSTIPPRGDAG